MRNISKAERVNKPWFYKRWGCAWRCPPHRQPEGAWLERYIDHPLLLHTQRSELVDWVVFAKKHRKKSSLVKMLKDPTGEANVNMSFAAFGLLGYMMAKRRAAKTGYLFSKENSQVLADLALAGFRFRDLVAFRLGQAGFTHIWSVLSILYIIPCIVAIIVEATIILTLAEAGETSPAAYLNTAGITLIVFAGMRILLLSAGLGIPTSFAVQMERSIRNRVEPLSVRTKRNIKEFFKAMGVVIICVIVGLGLIALLVVALFILGIINEPYLNSAIIITIGFFLLLGQPCLQRRMLYKLRVREMTALRRGDAIFDEFLMRAMEDGPSAGG